MKLSMVLSWQIPQSTISQMPSLYPEGLTEQASNIPLGRSPLRLVAVMAIVSHAQSYRYSEFDHYGSFANNKLAILTIQSRSLLHRILFINQLRITVATRSGLRGSCVRQGRGTSSHVMRYRSWGNNSPPRPPAWRNSINFSLDRYMCSKRNFFLHQNAAYPN